MKTAYVIEVSMPSGGSIYVREYQNKRQWVYRVHAKTATRFASEEEAKACVARHKIEKVRAIVPVRLR